MNTFSSVWVLSDNNERLAELVAGALIYGDAAQVITLNDEQSALAFRLGAEGVYQLSGKPADRMIEDYADTLVTLLQQQPGGLLLLANTRRCKLIGARLAARLGAALSNDASELAAEPGAVTVKHMVYGGLAFGTETLVSPLSIVSVNSGTFAPAEEDSAKQGQAQALAWQEPAYAVTCTGTQRRESHAVDLDKARLVVSVGRGIGSQENIALASSLCDAIGAELACSRPVAENEKWMPHERYVGISNLMLKPDLYLAVGISGQIQHMVGANGAQTIVAINKDKNAPIFHYADYGIVGDLFKILPALTQHLTH